MARHVTTITGAGGADSGASDGELRAPPALVSPPRALTPRRTAHRAAVRRAPFATDESESRVELS